ncbi:MAG: FAD-dependent oxidoreductase [Leeuwenhoekiella sp.]
MIEVDYIIVGFGLAGLSFCEQLDKYNKRFLVIDKLGDSASRVSGGIYNPVILKRYTLPWEAEKLMDIAVPYYKRLNEKLGTDFVEEMPVLRMFNSVEDQNNWFEAIGKPGNSRFLSKELYKNKIDGVQSQFHYGKVLETGRVQVPELLDAYRSRLEDSEQFINEEFDFDQINIDNNFALYRGIKARYIVFSEGYGVKNNPYFSKLPVVGNKGEYIFIKAKELQLNAALKSQFFIIPLGDHKFKVGATFNWKEKDSSPTLAAREEILSKLSKVLTSSFEVIDQEAGVRPTTGDRRALLGKHPQYPNLVIFNGLGTRGIMLSPYLSEILYNHLEHNAKLPESVDIMRFPKKF